LSQRPRQSIGQDRIVLNDEYPHRLGDQSSMQIK
jgi:hypothetical protein